MSSHNAQAYTAQIVVLRTRRSPCKRCNRADQKHYRQLSNRTETICIDKLGERMSSEAYGRNSEEWRREHRKTMYRIQKHGQPCDTPTTSWRSMTYPSQVSVVFRNSEKYRRRSASATFTRLISTGTSTSGPMTEAARQQAEAALLLIWLGRLSAPATPGHIRSGSECWDWLRGYRLSSPCQCFPSAKSPAMSTPTRSSGCRKVVLTSSSSRFVGCVPSSCGGSLFGFPIANFRAYIANERRNFSPTQGICE